MQLPSTVCHLYEVKSDDVIVQLTHSFPREAKYENAYIELSYGRIGASRRRIARDTAHEVEP